MYPTAPRKFYIRPPDYVHSDSVFQTSLQRAESRSMKFPVLRALRHSDNLNSETQVFISLTINESTEERHFIFLNTGCIRLMTYKRNGLRAHYFRQTVSTRSPTASSSPDILLRNNVFATYFGFWERVLVRLYLEKFQTGI